MNSFTASFFENNRKKLSSKLPNSLIVLSANSILQKSADTTYPFRQDSNFWYLTGINEPDIILVIDTKIDRTTILFPELNEYQKEWDGDFDQKDLLKVSGIKYYDSQNRLLDLMKDAINNKQKIAYLKPLDEIVQPYNFFANPARRKLYEKIMSVTDDPVDIRLELARLRQVKQPVELMAIQNAIDITGESLKKVKSNLSNFKTEAELNSFLTAEFYIRGADGHGFEPIIASSKNASTIHYRKNNSNIEPNSLILLDVGAEFAGYSADISRTWSVGNASKRQIDVYLAVLELQDKAFNILKPGVYIREYQKMMEKEAISVVTKLGASFAGNKFPHGFSHFLGIDVHDAGDYEQPLEENNVITVEPGIYLPSEGIGVRIEDDVRITKNGIEILSKNIPRDL